MALLLSRRGLLRSLGSVALAAAASHAIATHATAQAVGGLPASALGAELASVVHVDTLIPVGSVAGTMAADSAALRLALSQASPTLQLAPRAYLLDATALSNVALSGKRLLGHPGRTVLRQAVAPTRDMLSSVYPSNFVIDGITFDGGGFLTTVSGTGTTYPLFQPCVLIQGGSDFQISRCQFVGFYTCAVMANNTQRGVIADCTLDRGSPMSAPANYGIAVVGGGSNMLVRNNVLKACQIAVDASNSTIEGNDVAGWGFSAGINVGEDPSLCHDLTIRNNFCHDSATVPDRDGYLMEGIECWAVRATVEGNRCYRNLGNGISISGQNSVVSGNTCFDNGTAANPAHGIYQRSDTTNGSGSLISGNRCFDTRPSPPATLMAVPTQLWGYGQNSAAMTGIRLVGNDMDGCPSGALDTSTWSPDTTVDGWKTVPVSLSGVNVNLASVKALARIGATQTIFDLDITMPSTSDTTPFGLDGAGSLPASALPVQAAAFAVGYAPINGLRLMLDTGTGRIIADQSAGAVTNASLSGARIVATATWLHA